MNVCGAQNYSVPFCAWLDELPQEHPGGIVTAPPHPTALFFSGVSLQPKKSEVKKMFDCLFFYSLVQPLQIVKKVAPHSFSVFGVHVGKCVCFFR